MRGEARQKSKTVWSKRERRAEADRVREHATRDAERASGEGGHGVRTRMKWAEGWPGAGRATVGLSA